jgi:hypothetical protein
VTRQPQAEPTDLVRAVRGPDGLYRVEGTDRLFSGRIVRPDGQGAFYGREARACPECGAEEERV